MVTRAEFDELPIPGGAKKKDVQRKRSSIPAPSMARLRVPTPPPAPHRPGGNNPAKVGPVAAVAQVDRALSLDDEQRAEKQALGEKLHAAICRHSRAAKSAGKITGMMLELDNVELYSMLDNKAHLKAKVDEALRVLTPCRNWAKGGCKFGDKCRFLHDPKRRGEAVKDE